jgi:hypothetical protein
MTQDEADALSEDLRERVTELVNGEAFPFHRLHPWWTVPSDPAASTSELSLF